jgi:hypothetical protein
MCVGNRDVVCQVHFVNARHLKHVPGRKTDVKDCQWTKRVTASFTLARNDAGSAGLYHLEEQQL